TSLSANPPGSVAEADAAASHPLTDHSAAEASPRVATAPGSFVNTKLSLAVTTPPRVPTRTWYAYVPAGAFRGTRCRRVLATVAPGGTVTVIGPKTGSRSTGPVTAVQPWTVWGWSVVLVRRTRNWNEPPSGPMTTGPPTGSTETTTAAGGAPARPGTRASWSSPPGDETSVARSGTASPSKSAK